VHAGRRILAVVPAVLSLLVSARARADDPAAAPQKKLHYRVDVVEYTNVGFFGRDINDKGQLALTGLSATTPFVGIARLWDPKDGFVTLAPGPSYATGINNHGDVTVIRQQEPDIRFLSSLWTRRDGLIDLGTIGRQTWAQAVNDDRVVVGWTEKDNPQRDRYAFRWTQTGGLQTLPDLPGGQIQGDARAITPDGLIVGYSYGVNGQEAVRWTDAGVQGLGDLPGGRFESAAFAANNKGQIVGVGHVAGDGSDYDQDGNPDSFSRAFLWTPDNGMTNLGALHPGDDSIATGINDDGTITGWSVHHPGGTSIEFTAVIWTPDGAIIDLQQLLDERSQGWRLGAMQAGAINDSGQILLEAERDGQYAIVTLTPHNPEPGTLLIAATAGVLFSHRPRRANKPRP
jgi:uncharacterized membrane protein